MAIDEQELAEFATTIRDFVQLEVAPRVAAYDEAVQIDGTYSVSPEFRVGRAHRNARVSQPIERGPARSTFI